MVSIPLSYMPKRKTGFFPAFLFGMYCALCELYGVTTENGF